MLNSDGPNTLRKLPVEFFSSLFDDPGTLLFFQNGRVVARIVNLSGEQSEDCQGTES